MVIVTYRTLWDHLTEDFEYSAVIVHRLRESLGDYDRTPLERLGDVLRGESYRVWNADLYLATRELAERDLIESQWGYFDPQLHPYLPRPIEARVMRMHRRRPGAPEKLEEDLESAVVRLRLRHLQPA